MYTFKDNVDELEFENFVVNHKTKCHFLQSTLWEKISIYRGYKTFRLGMYYDKNLVGTALLLKKSLPFNLSYFYIPRGFVTDFNNEDYLKEFTQYINKFTKKHNSIFFKIDPDLILKRNNNIEQNTLTVINNLENAGYKRRKLTYFFETAQPRFTFRIDIDKTLEEIEKNFAKGAKQGIKHAIQCGVKVFEGNKDDIKDFYKIMHETEVRKDFYAHSENYYNYFYDVFKNNTVLYLASINLFQYLNKVKVDIEDSTKKLKELDPSYKSFNQNKKELEAKINRLNNELDFYKDYEVKDEETYINSSLTVYYGDKAWALYAGNDNNYRTFQGNHILYRERIKTAVSKHLKEFDAFGTIGKDTTDKSVSGLHEFKKKFGGDFIEFAGEFNYIQKPIINFLYNSIIPIRRKIVNIILKFKNKKKHS